MAAGPESQHRPCRSLGVDIYVAVWTCGRVMNMVLSPCLHLSFAEEKDLQRSKDKTEGCLCSEPSLHEGEGHNQGGSLEPEALRGCFPSFLPLTGASERVLMDHCDDSESQFNYKNLIRGLN